MERRSSSPQPEGVDRSSATVPAGAAEGSRTAIGDAVPAEGDGPAGTADPAAGHSARQPRARHRRRHRNRNRLLVTMLGVLLLWGALALSGYAAGWQSHKSQAQVKLLDGEKALVQHVEHQRRHGAAPCVATATKAGQLAGVLQIPALHLSAPVEEGTTDAELNVAVGHDASSVWPGQSGTSVLLAHDVSYFVHLNALEPGDRIVYQTACTSMTYTVTGQQVVQQGTSVPNSTTSTLVLDTCYPPNALFFTTQRLLVSSVEAPAGGSGASPGPAAKRTSITMPAQDEVTYTVPAPAPLVAQGLTLQQNEAPMGTMSLSGQTSPSWEQSPGPLALEGAALEAYFGGIDSAEQAQPTWWAPIAEPGVAMPAPLVGATISGHDSPLDVDIHSTAGRVTSVALSTTITITGGPSPGTFDETVTLPVHGSTVLIGSWVLTPAT